MSFLPLICSAKQRPRLWMDSGSQSLLGEFWSGTKQVLEQQTPLGQATAELEQSLLLKIMSRVSASFAAKQASDSLNPSVSVVKTCAISIAKFQFQKKGQGVAQCLCHGKG